MSRFWEKTQDSEVEVESFNPTTYVIDIDKETGDAKLINIDALIDPLSLLDYSDFSLSECIKHGVSYKSLNITPDMRIGHEAEFDKLAARFDDLTSNLYVQSVN